MARRVKYGDPVLLGRAARRGGPIRLKFDTGEKVAIKIVDEPVIVREHFVEAKGYSLTCSKMWDEKSQSYAGKCPACEQGLRASERYALKVLEIERNDESVGKYRLWKIGQTRYCEISGIIEESECEIGDITLVIKCTAKKYQKMNIMQSSKKRTCTVDNSTDFDIHERITIPRYETLAEKLGKAEPVSVVADEGDDYDVE